MRGRVRKLAAPAGAALVLAGLAVPAGAEGRGHDAVNFSFNGRPTDSYRVREDDPGDAVVEATRAQHGRDPATVDVVPSPGSEGDPADSADYDSGVKTLRFGTCCESADTKISIDNDGQEEPLETVELELEHPTSGMITISPSDALLTIVDDDGTSRVAFERQGYEAFESNEVASGDTGIDLRLLRSGSTDNPMTVSLGIQNGTATEGDDFSFPDTQVTIPAGEWMKKVTIPFTNDSKVEDNETFQINMEAAGQPTSSVEVTILDNDGNTITDYQPPVAAFHQPLHGKEYEPWELETFLAFMQDDFGGSGVKRVDLAIRMNRDDGVCRWWNGTRFRRGGCGKRQWAETGRGTETKVAYYDETAVFTLGKLLRSSARKTYIKSYTAYCRARDKAGNLQDNFYKKQNFNTFEVIPKP
ncbi:MAG: hypothetical protein M3198_00900 [Actinomycetota bacterium]|nr:hypothetical protein [Actinomycetota bacterium]